MNETRTKQEKTLNQQQIQIRPMTPDDASAICQIWSTGLDQTSEACQWSWTKSIVAKMMENLRQSATSDDGDIGPDGKNLISHWMNHDDRVMLVGELAYDNNNEKRKVAGCCGVKIGTSESLPGPEKDIGSVWRVSIDASARKKGVGRSLMAEAELWSQARNCTKMQLITGNRIAGEFYKSLGYHKRYWILDALDLPCWFEKELK